MQKSIRKTKKKAKITYYSKFLHKYKTDSKQTWQVVKEVNGKWKTKHKINLLARKCYMPYINLHKILQALLEKEISTQSFYRSF